MLSLQATSAGSGAHLRHHTCGLLLRTVSRGSETGTIVRPIRRAKCVSGLLSETTTVQSPGNAGRIWGFPAGTESLGKLGLYGARSSPERTGLGDRKSTRLNSSH